MRSALVSVFAAIVGIAPTWANPLSPGSDAPVCNNMLVPGSMTKCLAKTDAPDAPPGPVVKPPLAPNIQVPAKVATQRLPMGGVSEEAIDDYLASYGKPPREAVRALLNPTDDNIAALAAAERKRQVIAAYVADRWSEFQQKQSTTPTKATLDAYTILPLFVGMRLVLYVAPACADCDAAVAIAKQLVEENPVLDTRLVVIAESESAALSMLLRFGASLPVSTLSPQQAAANGLSNVPLVEVTDTRNGRRGVFSGASSLAALRDAVISLRKPPLTTKENNR